MQNLKFQDYFYEIKELLQAAPWFHKNGKWLYSQISVRKPAFANDCACLLEQMVSADAH